MISMGFDPVWMAAFVKASCDAQGIAVKVTAPVVLARVGALLGVTTGGRRAHGAPAPSTPAPAVTSQPPNGLLPGRLEPASTGDTRTDDRVVQQRAHDRRLSFEVLVRPAFG